MPNNSEICILESDSSEKDSPKPSAFRVRVFEQCALIPEGKVATYGQLARVLNTSPRAVGQALKMNRMKEVPCHRVVRSDLTIGGFHGQVGEQSHFVQRKITMLMKENVEFDESGAVRRECLCSDQIFEKA